MALQLGWWYEKLMIRRVVMENAREFGIIGLGKMGANLSLQALEKGIRVVGYTLEGVSAELKNAGMVDAKSPDKFKDLLASPRAIFLYIPAGPMVDQLLDQLAPLLNPGD